MRKQDRQIGKPSVEYSDSLENLNALTDVPDGSIAYDLTNKLFVARIESMWVPIGGTGEIPAGGNTGDFIRFNQVTGDWEVATEPLHVKGIVLTPALSSMIDAEGAIYYNSSTKSVMVCTDI